MEQAHFSGKTGKVTQVVDIAKGNWTFAFTGAVIRKALYEKIHLQEQELGDIYDTLASHVGADPKEVALLLVALSSNHKNWRTEMVSSLIKRATALQEDIHDARLAAQGFAESMIYTMALEDMKRLGVGLLHT